MQDALNKEIVIGNDYGYSNNKNGFTTIVIGKASRLTEKGVTLDVIVRKRALYDSVPEIDLTHGKKVNVKSNMLFPINLND